MNTTFLPSLLKEDEAITKQLRPYIGLIERQKKIQELIKDYQNGDSDEIPFKEESHRESSHTDFPREYDRELTQKQKIYVALFKIGSGYVNDVANSLVKIAPNDYEFSVAKTIAGDKLSFLYTKGIISADQVGRKKKYKIKSV